MKFHRALLFAAVLLLIYPHPLPAQQERQQPITSIGGLSGSPGSADGLEQSGECTEKGNAKEEFNLGMRYLQGNGVPQDFGEAAKWLRKAAEQGEISAQCMLGAIYADGLGVMQDYLEAYKWLTLSADLAMDKQSQVIRKAMDLRDSIAGKMTQQQTEEARRLAREWAYRLQAKMDNGIYHPGRGVTPPVILVEAKPYYTDEARRSHIQGINVIQFVVRKDGTTYGFKALKKLGYGLDESAINTIKTRYRFKPGTYQGKPVDVQIVIETTFKLF